MFGRFWFAVPVLALAGNLARKKIVPTGAGTLPTYTPLYVGMLIGVTQYMLGRRHLPQTIARPEAPKPDAAPETGPSESARIAIILILPL